MKSVENQIYRQIRRKPPGTVVFPEDFSRFGHPDTIHKALQRLEAKNEIRRLAHGIYARPIINPYIGEVLPSAENVAEAIARRDKIRVVPTGAYALHALGLSTQIPMKIVLLTDGTPREITVGKRTIKFKKTTPKTLLAKGGISKLAIQALKSIGKDKVSPETKEKITELLQREKKEDLQHDLQLAPVWIRHLLQQS